MRFAQDWEIRLKSPCDLPVLCVSVVNVLLGRFSTKAEFTETVQRLEAILC